MPDLLLGGIAINEFLADPNGASNFDTDGSGAARGGDEFVELINTSGSAIDISGLELWDAGRDNWFTFPPGTVLQPGAVALVVRNVQFGGTLPSVTGDDLAFDADFAGNIFNNSGDNLVVYDPTNDEFIQATFNGDTLDDPTATPPNTYLGFSSTATRIGAGEDFGNDQDGFSIQRTSTGFSNNDTPTPGMANVCFVSGTLIGTPDGFVAIEQLRLGDRINTRDSGPQPIRWIFRREIGLTELLSDPRLCPVILPGTKRLKVSRHHRVLVGGKIAQRMFGEDEVLVPAKDLVGACGVELDRNRAGFCYHHILLDSHNIINADGLAAESLYLGAEGLHAMTPSARKELELIFPSSSHADSFLPPPLCLPSVAGRRVRHLAQRHHKNDRPLVETF